jgi:DNA-binding transcriptional ArsR family regulator
LRKQLSPVAARELLNSVPLFAALGDAVRLQLVVRLSEQGSVSISKLTSGTGITRQAITKHLRVMQDSGLVGSTRRGRERIWQLNQQRLEDARHQLDLISKQWNDALARLQRFVED